MALDRIAERHGLGPWKKRFHGLVCDGPIAGKRVVLLEAADLHERQRPSVGEAQRYLKIARGRHLSSSTTSSTLRPASSRSRPAAATPATTACARSRAHIGNEYARVRIGIGHPGSKDAGAALRAARFRQGRRGLARAAARCDRRRRCRGWPAGDDARFLTDVARAAAGRDKGKPERADVQRPSAAPAEPAPASAPRAHPAGERQAKRGSALAENLKKWLHGPEPRET